MKKLFCILLAVLLIAVLSVAVTGCDSNKAKIKSIDIMTDSEKDRIILSGVGLSSCEIESYDGGILKIRLSNTKLGKTKYKKCDGGVYAREISAAAEESDTLLSVYTEGRYLAELSYKNGNINIELSDIEQYGFYIKEKQDNTSCAFYSERFGFNYSSYWYRIQKNSEPGSFTVAIRYLPYSDQAVLVCDTERLSYIKMTQNEALGTLNADFFAKRGAEYALRTSDDGSYLIMTLSEKSNEKEYDLTGSKVVIDAGHGGSDYGAVYPLGAEGINIELAEKDINLDMARRLQVLLEADGINTVMTRTDDSTVELEERGRMINAADADMFLSIHNNSGNSFDSGTMMLYYPGKCGAKNSFTNEAAAQIFQDTLLDMLQTKDRGIFKRPRLVVLNRSDILGVMAEVAYISGEEDRARLQDDSFRQAAAEALKAAVEKTLAAMKNADTDSGITDMNEIVSEEVWNKYISAAKAGNIGGVIVPARGLCEYLCLDEAAANRSQLKFSVKIPFSKWLGGEREDIAEELCYVLEQCVSGELVEQVMNCMEEITTEKPFAFQDDITDGNNTAWIRGVKDSGNIFIDIIK